MRTHYETVYAGLGRLFYSIAASDRHIASAEQHTLNDLIKHHWLPLERSTDKFGVDAAHYIAFAFDHAAAQKMQVDVAFNVFKEAFTEHPSLFTEAVKDLLWITATAIASARAGENKAEHARLIQLRRLLRGERSHA